MITVTVNDGQPQNNLVTRTFTVVVNAAPTVSGLTNVVINEDSVSSVVSLIIGDAETAASSLTVSASSSNAGLVPGANIIPGGSGANRTLSITPLADQFGFSTITVSVADPNGNVSSNTFLLTVAPVNDAPTLNALANLTIPTNAGPQTVNLTGISSGAANENQRLSIQATSSNPSVIPDPTVNYISANTSGSLTFAPVLNATGVVTMTVKLMDDGGAANGGTNSITRTFTVNVLPISSVPPVLQIVRAGTNIVISWPADAGPAWSLQCSMSINNSGSWGPVFTPPVIVNGRYTVTNSAAGSAKYYRLILGSPPSTEPGPSLSISEAGDKIVLSWPADAGNYILERRSNLDGDLSTGWLPVSKAVVVLNNRNTVTLDTSQADGFFRLRAE
jgi:hypothetical protein